MDHESEPNTQINTKYKFLSKAPFRSLMHHLAVFVF